ncbi:glutamate 5-kinase [Kordiimonas laminariae]|uniref:glutamate 5-kinase n=1 Tax=Kordiimonas laminariae TaxID=2917717 RepID=UPI001FF40A1F|nr:glutamate 5-kinase [Kordiimonas laminariae]MCK0068296.1 glutamate 5-kinase [Kordiimonas laminariae]
MQAESHHTLLKTSNRVVIKIGSALLVDGDGLRKDWMEALADDVAMLRSEGKQVILVSSGAIAMGREALGYTSRPKQLEEAQAAAAIGQIKLAQAYQSLFDKHDTLIAQVLLTIDDMEDRPRYLNARNTVEALLDHGAVPLINENDTVATTEIRFGDNDRLAARVAQMASADALLLLSDIDGLYNADPRSNADAQHLPVIENISADIEDMAGPPAQQGVGSGGMITKIGAAKIALAGGCSMIIMNGDKPNPVKRLLGGERNTLFPATTTPLAVRKQWIQGMMAPKGFIHVDEGAVNALKKGASLLSAGVTEVDGNFERGDLIAIMGPDGHLVGQGLISYPASDAEKMMGLKSSEANAILGHAGRSSLIHRDDLVLL